MKRVAYGMLCAMWMLPISVLAVHWSVNENFGFGWLVPILVVVCTWRRWKGRPPAGRPLSSGVIFVVGASVAFLPTWLFVQPNIEWTLLAWLLVVEFILITFGFLSMAGGLKWALYVCSPIGMFLCAIPFPNVVYIPATQWLMGWIASVTVELLNLVGVAAMRHGNIVELTVGMLGIDEACSGVKSVHAAVFVAVVLGELYRLGLWKRFGLLVAGGVVAVVSNVIRATVLGFIAATSDVEQAMHRHDLLGAVCLGGVLVLLWLIGLMFFREGDKSFQNTVGHMDGRWPVRSVAVWSVWMFGSVAAVEAWYFDPSAPQRGRWGIIAPAGSVSVPLSEAVNEQLRPDYGLAESWRGSDGSEWICFFFEWFPGPAQSRVLARVHRPEVCLTSAGFKMSEDRGSVEVVKDGMSLPFRAYTFEDQGRLVFVYYGIWQNRTARALRNGPFSESAHIASLQSVLWRERNLGQYVAEFAVTGYRTALEADRAFIDAATGVISMRNSDLK